MKVLSRVCSKFEKRPIELKFDGRNINLFISKMKNSKCTKLNDNQYLMLECCLLFLCGFSFEDIACRLNISYKQVIDYLKDNELSYLLSDEYYVLYQNNRYRLNLNSTMSEKIKKAVSVYVKYNGNILETCNEVGIAPRTFRSYVSHPNLEEIVDDPDLFLQFMLLRGNKVNKKSIEQVSVKSEQQQLMKDLMLLEPTNIIEHKYLILAKAILIQKLDSIDDIVENTELFRTSVVSYLDDFSRCEAFFPSKILDVFKEEGSFILRKASKKASFDEFAIYVISHYMSSRYTIDEMRTVLNLTKGEIKYIINEKAKEVLNDEEFKKLCKHKRHIGHIGLACPSDCAIVKDPKLIRILKPDVVYLNEYQDRLIMVLNDFLNVGEQLHVKDVKPVTGANIQFLNSNFKELNKLLNQDVYNKLKKNLEIEYLLVGSNLREKNKYVGFVLKQFLENDMSLEQTSQVLNIDIPILIRVLQDPYISIYYGSILSQYINGSIQEYRIQYVEKNSEDSIDFDLQEFSIILENKKKVKKRS